MKTSEVGMTVPIISAWWDENRDGAEPTTIDLVITSPDGTVLTLDKTDMTDVSEGATSDTWEYALTGAEEGAYVWAMVGVVGGRTIKSDGVILFGPASASPGPCATWCSWDDVIDACPEVPALTDEARIPLGARDAILERVTWILYMLDGGRYPGICTTTRSVCRECSTCRRTSCCCPSRDSIDLKGRFPVFAAWGVTIDGTELDRSAYQLRDNRWLVRTDGERWPSCADLTDSDGFSATWAYGRNPPVGLKHAAAVFAREIAKGCLDEVCALPERVTTVNREGTTYVVLDSQKFLDEGRVGIYDVDLALIAARPPAETKQGSFPGGGSPLAARRVSTHRSV